MKHRFLIVMAASLGLAVPAAAEIPEALVLKMKKAVVNVEKSVMNALSSEQTGRFHGTGFIVDAKRGIIATNRHVSGTSPTQVKITFENGDLKFSPLQVFEHDPKNLEWGKR